MSGRMSVERARRLTDGGVHTIHGGLVIHAARTIVDQADQIARVEDELHHVTQHALAQGRRLRAKQLQVQRLQKALRAGLGAHALDVDDLIRDGYLTEEDMQ